MTRLAGLLRVSRRPLRPVVPGHAKREPGTHFAQHSNGAMDSGLDAYASPRNDANLPGLMVRDGAERLLTMRVCRFCICRHLLRPHPEERPKGRVSKDGYDSTFSRRTSPELCLSSSLESRGSRECRMLRRTRSLACK